MKRAPHDIRISYARNEMSTDVGTSAPDVHRNGNRLYRFALLIVAFAVLYFGLTAKVRDPLHLYQGIIIMVLGMWPSILWAKHGSSSLPMFEILMLTSANTYGIPLLNDAGLNVYDEETITVAATGILLYQIIAIAAYSGFKGMPGRGSFFTDEVLSHDLNKYVGYGLALTTLYTFTSTYYDIIPYELVGVTRPIFYGCGVVAVFVQARRWGAGELPPGDRVLLSFNMAIQVIIQFSTLFLVGGISIVILALVGYVAGSRRLPILLTAGVLGIVAMLHNGKGDMREKYWSADGTRRQATVTELPEFFSEWIAFSLSPTDHTEGDKRMTGKLLDRTSLFHILCLVTSRTPDPLPFLGGETYAQIPGQFVPRFFWPEKPVGHVSTSTLAVYYGLQRLEETAKTTIGFGTVTEAYANFGILGVAFLGSFYGLLYKKVLTLSVNSPLLSYAGLLQIVLLAWSFQTEFPMSLWLSSMFQACVAIMGVPFAVRRLAG